MDLEPGACYLIKEGRRNHGYRLFSMRAPNTPGLVLTRQFPDRVRSEHRLADSRVIWLSHTPGPDSHTPTALGCLAKLISDFIDGNEGGAMILLDGLEYLSINNGFLQTLKFVEWVSGFVKQRKAIVLIPVSPKAFEVRELALLEGAISLVEAPARKEPPSVVLLIPTKPELRHACEGLRDRLPQPSRVDDSTRPVEDKIRDARRSGIPFVVLISGGEAESGIVHVLPWAGSETWMTLETLDLAFREWRSLQ